MAQQMHTVEGCGEAWIGAEDGPSAAAAGLLLGGGGGVEDRDALGQGALEVFGCQGLAFAVVVVAVAALPGDAEVVDRDDGAGEGTEDQADLFAKRKVGLPVCVEIEERGLREIQVFSERGKDVDGVAELEADIGEGGEPVAGEEEAASFGLDGDDGEMEAGEPLGGGSAVGAGLNDGADAAVEDDLAGGLEARGLTVHRGAEGIEVAAVAEVVAQPRGGWRIEDFLRPVDQGSCDGLEHANGVPRLAGRCNRNDTGGGCGAREVVEGLG